MADDSAQWRSLDDLPCPRGRAAVRSLVRLCAGCHRSPNTRSWSGPRPPSCRPSIRSTSAGGAGIEGRFEISGGTEGIVSFDSADPLTTAAPDGRLSAVGDVHPGQQLRAARAGGHRSPRRRDADRHHDVPVLRGRRSVARGGRGSAVHSGVTVGPVDFAQASVATSSALRSSSVDRVRTACPAEPGPRTPGPSGPRHRWRLAPASDRPVARR
jgi:hypothetical protein